MYPPCNLAKWQGWYLFVPPLYIRNPKECKTMPTNIIQDETPLKKPAMWVREPLPYVKKVIAVASGKGGVGKSTTAVNLAVALTAAGKRVGILDADIYGPSIPHLMGLSGQPEFKEQMIPLTSHGIVCNSMGFIIGDQAAVLRGPMITKALNQLLRMTRWGTKDAPLDILLVDMPPGTGDIHLSMAQQVPLSGAIIVTTPQEVALIDARKCAQMFMKVHVPVLGVIENMSGSIFGCGGGAKMAHELNVPLLGTVPMQEAICKAGENRTPEHFEAYGKIASHPAFAGA
jgi:ATP-binding protein involved in chromosome partitioning